MTLRYIPSKYSHEADAAARSLAKIDDSDPFCFARTKSELLHMNCKFGLPSEVAETAARMNEAREKALRFDAEAARKIKKHLGLE